MKKQIPFILLFLAAFVFMMMASGDLAAQGCSQCKMVPMSDQQGGGTAALGINKAILYLMAMPYIILGLLFRKQIAGLYRQLKAKR